MNQIVKAKLIEHIIGKNVFTESEMQEVYKIFEKDVKIFYCEDCKYNSFITKYKSLWDRELRDYPNEPKCDKCKKPMKRIVINQIEENLTVKEFLRLPRKKIFCFISSKHFIEDGDVMVVSLSEDGEGLCSHYSSEGFAKIDIGITSDNHHKEYILKYPNGFELIWIKDKDFDSNKDLQKSYKLHCLKKISKAISKIFQKKEMVK